MHSIQSVSGPKPMGIEEAAIDHWNKALDDAERHRRTSRRAEESPAHEHKVDASACA